MANIVFSESSGVNDSIFGKSQAPIRQFIEKKGEQFEQESIVKRLFRQDADRDQENRKGLDNSH